jgi:hypothetical protein
MTALRVFLINKHSRVLFSKFLQRAPPKDMYGLNKHKIHTKYVIAFFTILQNVGCLKQQV